MSVSKNLKIAMENKGIKAEELSDSSGVPASRISEIVNGKTQNPQMKTLTKLAAALEVTVDLLIGKNSHHSKTNLVPVYGTVPAGWPDEIIESEVLGWIPVEGSTHGLAGLRVEGHSMSPEIKDGDYVLYKNDYDLRAGDIIIATNEFNSAMVKKYALKDGEPWLVSINPEYPAFKVNDHYRIIGRVIERISKEKIGRQ